MIENILEYSGLFGLIVLTISFAISFIVVPRIINVVNYKELMDDPNDRSSHTTKTPTLGGIAFFISLLLSLFFINQFDSSGIGFNIIGGLTILFIVGIKDDLVVLSARTKIIAQLIAVTFILVHPELHMLNLHGFLGISQIPIWIAVLFSYFTVLAVINGINLIDGIDGLASMVGIVIFSIFAYVFYQLNIHYYFLVSMIGVGFLAAFLRYNLSGKMKIFMGDTGSMIIGFVIGLLTLRFLALEAAQLVQVSINPPLVLLFAVSILFIPFLDTIRVFSIRVLNKKSPFSPDRNHIHHVLINMGWSHKKTSMVLSMFNLAVFALITSLSSYVTTLSLVVILASIFLLSVVILFALNTNYAALKQKIKIRSVFIKQKALNYKLQKERERLLEMELKEYRKKYF